MDGQSQNGNSVVFGIDPSSKKMAIVALYDDQVITKVVHARTNLTQAASLVDLGSGVAEFCGDTMFNLGLENGPVVFYMEEPVVGRNIKSTVVQAQAGGAVMYSLYDNFAEPIFQVNNKTWKKDIVGNGNASKDMVGLWLLQNHKPLYDLTGGDQDLIDATCIALYAREKVELGKRIRQGLS